MMIPETKAKYIEYIAAGLRHVKAETGHYVPDDTIIVCGNDCELAQFDTIMGIDIYISDVPSSFEYFIAFKSYHSDRANILKAFTDYLETYDRKE